MSFIVKNIISVANLSSRLNIPVISVFQIREYAARKGTREKARKKKVKLEVKKVGFIPHNQRGLDKMLLNRQPRKFSDSYKPISTDNVYPQRFYKWRVYPFLEAVQCHRETHHPTIYNVPDAPLKVIIELNMAGEKKTKFVDNFTRVVTIPHPFDHGEERNIIAFSKDLAMQQQARDLGAALAGGIELIKQIQSGDISLQDFQHFLAHPNILPELVCLRGLMKKRFPNPKNETLNVDIPAMVMKYLHGISYQAIKDEYEKDFGVIECSIGPLSMDAKHLEENYSALVNDINKAKPKRSGTFITRTLLVCAPSSEKLKVDHKIYTGEVDSDDQKLEEDDEEEEENEKAQATA